MHNVYIQHDLNISQPLKKGIITLLGSTGKRYPTEALEVPGYGWVPCSQKLRNNFTTNPKHLVLVISDSNDEDIPVTSPIWVSYTDTEFVTLFGKISTKEYAENLDNVKRDVQKCKQIPKIEHCCSCRDERPTYEEFAGSYAQDVMEYDDQTIYDAFEGDPDVYWNID